MGSDDTTAQTATALAAADAPNYQPRAAGSRCVECRFGDAGCFAAPDDPSRGCRLYAFTAASGYRPWWGCDSFQADRFAMSGARALHAVALRETAAGVPNELLRSGTHRPRLLGGKPHSGPSEIVVTEEMIDSMLLGFALAKEASFFAGGGAPVGYEHAELEALGSGMDPADVRRLGATIDSLSKRTNDDGTVSLVGDLAYTDEGRAKVRSGEFRGFSLVFVPPGSALAKDGEPINEYVPLGGTLTNTPFVRGMDAVAASERGVRAMASKLGDRLRRLRDEQELSNEDLASAAGIDVSTMGSILSGEIVAPPRRRLEGLADLLNVSVQSLINDIPASDRERSEGESAMSDLYNDVLGLTERATEADRVSAIHALREKAGKAEVLSETVKALTEERDTARGEVKALSEHNDDLTIRQAVHDGRIGKADASRYLKVLKALGEEEAHAIFPADAIATTPKAPGAAGGDATALTEDAVWGEVEKEIGRLKAAGIPGPEALDQAVALTAQDPAKAAILNRNTPEA